MAISEQLKSEIEQEILNLAPGSIKPPGASHSDLMTELSRVYAQVYIDRIPLEKSKFDFTLMIKYEAYLELLSYTMGNKGVSLGVKGDAQAGLDQLMSTVKDGRKILLKFVKFIVEETGSSEAPQAYEYIKKGTGDIDSANDCIMMVAFSRKHSDFFKKVAPLGREVDEQFLQAVESAAVSVLKAKGQAIATSADSTKLVERQNRIISLCCDALTFIKRYADMAFEQDYYDQYYADRNDRSQRQSARSQDTEELQTAAS